jgi:hypothetical protein
LTSLLAGPKVSQNLFVVTHTPQQKSVQNKNKSFFCASFGQKCTKETRVVSHIVTLPFTLLKKSILRQKKNYQNTQIFHHPEIIIFPKSSKKKPKILQDIIITLL